MDVHVLIAAGWFAVAFSLEQGAPPLPRALKIGEVVNGETTAESGVVHTPTLDKNYTDAPVHGVSSRADLPSGPVTIELRSYFFDAYLVVRDAMGNIVAEDDDGLLRTHARVVLAPDTAAEYEVDACALHGATGPYELRIVAGAPVAMSAGDLQQAELADARRAVSVVEGRMGQEHPQTATSIKNLAEVLEARGVYEEARTLYERALAIDEKALGPNHREIATDLNNLAVLLRSQGRLERARPLLERALAIREEVLGPDHPHTAMSLNNLAALLQSMGKYEEARPLLERALAIWEKALGTEHPSTAKCLDNLAWLLTSQGKYEEARPLCERALAIDEKAFGAMHEETARDLNNLAVLLRFQGKYDDARPLNERAVAIDEKALGPDHPDTAMCLNNLAALLESQGKYEEARPLFERALAIREKALGSAHPDTAMSLNNLAGLLDSQGKYEEARPLYERALAIREKASGPKHPDTAMTLSNLARLLAAHGKCREARPLYERALAIYEAAFGPECPDAAIVLNNLAALIDSQGNHDEARSLYERARDINEKALGPKHPHTSYSLNNLAKLLQSQGKYEEARSLYARALTNLEVIPGPAHPDTTSCVNSVALVELDLREQNRARTRAHELVQSRRVHAFEEAAATSADDALRMFASIQGAIATLLSTEAAAQRASDELYADVLLNKGEAFRFTTRRSRTLFENTDPDVRLTVDRLRSVRAAMSNLFSARNVGDRDEYDRDIERLRKEREECERKLAKIADSRPALQSATPAQVRASLPLDAVLLDFLEHPLYEPAQWKGDHVEKLGKWGERRFSVWISRGGADHSEYVDLGPSAPIEAAIRKYLSVAVGANALPRGAGAVERLPGTDERSRARAAAELRRLIWDPIALHVADASRLFVSADGAIALLPFGILVDAEGIPLIERFRMAWVDDASRLVRPPLRTAAPPSPPDPTLISTGDVDYFRRGDRSARSTSGHDRRGHFDGEWRPLEGTKLEAEGVESVHAKWFPRAARLTLRGADATEERLDEEMPKYSVLHLATHGYFNVEDLPSVTDALLGDGDRAPFGGGERRLLAAYWPQFLCGIVCAGANHPQPGRDNGLLTGDEVSGLDLSHCDLVVLSACETALGKRQTGEGLLSLTRCFRAAGARTVVSSLWRVNDDSTRDLMLDFYDRLWNRHESKLDALRDAQLAMLRRNREKYGGDARPATWGAFVLTGDPE